MAITIYFPLLTALAALALCALEAEARLVLPWPLAKETFVQLHSSAESAGDSDAKSSSAEASEGSTREPSGSSQKEGDANEANQSSTSSGTESEAQEASKQEDQKTTSEDTPEGSSEEESESSSASNSAGGSQTEGQEGSSQEGQRTNESALDTSSNAEKSETNSNVETPAAGSAGEEQPSNPPATEQQNNQAEGKGEQQPVESTPSKSDKEVQQEGKGSSPENEQSKSQSEAKTPGDHTHEHAAPPSQESEPEPKASQTEKAAEQHRSAAHEERPLSASATEQSPEAASATDSPAVSTAEDPRMQSITLHDSLTAEADKFSETFAGPKVEELTAHCVMTHNKIRTARLDQWPDPLNADDGLAEVARNRAKEYISNNCQLPEKTKLDPLVELMAQKNGKACDGLSYVFLDGLSEMEKVLHEKPPGSYNPTDPKNAWHSENAQKLALLMSETGRSVGCAATTGCAEDYLFCHYFPKLAIGNEVISTQIYNALKKRESVETHGLPFLASKVADHEVKSSAGAKVKEFESSSASAALPLTFVAIVAVPILGTLRLF